MLNRRKFIAQTGIISAGYLHLLPGKSHNSPTGFISKRPPAGQRKFASKAIEDVIVRTVRQIKDPEIAWMFENCFPNTLDTTVNFRI